MTIRRADEYDKPFKPQPLHAPTVDYRTVDGEITCLSCRHRWKSDCGAGDVWEQVCPKCGKSTKGLMESNRC